MKHYCVECGTREVNKAGQKCKECARQENERKKAETAYERDTRKNWHTNDWLRSLGDK